MVTPDLKKDILPDFIQGDRKAFTKIFHHFYRPLCHFAIQLVRDREEADSIVQEIFFKLWCKHAGFQTVRNLEAFLYLRTRNACFNHFRHRQVMKTSCREKIFLDGDRTDELMINKMIRAELMEEIYNAVERLPEKRREVFKLAYFEGLNNEDIAQSMRISVHTVKEHKYRALYDIQCHFGKRLLK
jgi:RNA polymerase sigma-70 factor (ECF subfamily)